MWEKEEEGWAGGGEGLLSSIFEADTERDSGEGREIV